MPPNTPPRGGGKRPPAKRGRRSSWQSKKRRQQRIVAGLGIAVVLGLVAGIVGFGILSGTTNSASAVDTRSAISPVALASVLAVTPTQMKAAAGASSVKLSSYPLSVGAKVTLTAAGKPELLYLGAEYCPFCAGERWAMVLALAQFGTFSGLRTVTSQPGDTPASIPTFTFYQSTYTSDYVAFRPVETQTVSGKTLEIPTAAELADEQHYDAPPYSQKSGIPYLDFGGQWIQDGINFDNTDMQAKSFPDVAQQVATQSTQTGAKIAATAGVMISHLCQMTGGKSLHGNAACLAFPSVISAAPTS